MKLDEWSKVILSYYNYIEKSVRAIDKYVLDKCVYTSYFDCGLNFDIEKRVEKVGEMIDKKRRFINLKVIIEKALSEIDEKHQKILILFYFDNLSCEKIAELLGVNLRTIFRYKNSALVSFSRALSRNGFKEDFFNENYKKDRWLFLTNSCETKDGKIRKVNEYRLISSIYSRLS